MSVNKMIIVGNLGQTPELRTTGSGKSVCNLRVATNAYKDETVWFDVICFERRAENCCKYLKSGSQVFVEGRLQLREWETREGEKRTSVEIVANDVQFLSGKGDDKPRQEETPRYSSDESSPY